MVNRIPHLEAPWHSMQLRILQPSRELIYYTLLLLLRIYSIFSYNSVPLTSPPCIKDRKISYKSLPFHIYHYKDPFSWFLSYQRKRKSILIKFYFEINFALYNRIYFKLFSPRRWRLIAKKSLFRTNNIICLGFLWTSVW